MYNPSQLMPAWIQPVRDNGTVRAKASLASLYATHRSALEKKHLHDLQTLKRVLDHDLRRIGHALNEVQTFDVNQALHQFFGQEFTLLPEFIRESHSHRLNHMGLEIYTPLDVWLALAEHWPPRLTELTGQVVEIVRTTRFPSSQALQTRVGASVEIMCVWFRQGNTGSMIEVFDIGRPVPDAILSRIMSAGDSFREDIIWHYAIDMPSIREVDQIHEQFTQLVVSHPEYKLAYFQPVTNRHDGSYHTKIIHRQLGMELEFATHQIPPN